MGEKAFNTAVRGRRVLNVISSAHQERDWAAETTRVEAGTLDAAAAVPASKDLREGAVTVGSAIVSRETRGYAASRSPWRTSGSMSAPFGQTIVPSSLSTATCRKTSGSRSGANMDPI